MNISLFALQIFLPLEPTGPLRSHLHGLVRNSSPSDSHTDRRNFHVNVADALLRWPSHFQYGVWDYFDSSEMAQTEYDSWVEGTLDDAAEAKTKLEADAAYRVEVGAYMFVTFAMLIEKGSASDTFVSEMCNVPEPDMWKRATFERMLSVPAQINFANLHREVLFIRPGTHPIGVTRTELEDEKYGYLRMIT